MSFNLFIFVLIVIVLVLVAIIKFFVSINCLLLLIYIIAFIFWLLLLIDLQNKSLKEVEPVNLFRLIIFAILFLYIFPYKLYAISLIACLTKVGLIFCCSVITNFFKHKSLRKLRQKKIIYNIIGDIVVDTISFILLPLPISIVLTSFII